jgi:hypothetical protein
MQAAIGVLTIFAFVFTAGLAVGVAQKNTRFLDPNVPLPASINSLVPKTNNVFIGPVPWLTTLVRNDLTCKREKICDQDRAFVVTLPTITENTWYLSTQSNFVTNYFVAYPIATVLIVPKDTPKTRKFIIDNTYNGFGIRPSIDQNNVIFPLNEDGDGRNVTGDFAHSFVLKNEAAHDILFARQAFDGAIKDGTYLDYWTLSPGSITLFWPGERYWNSKESNIKRTWNASELPKNLSNDVLAHIAESMMYTYLAPIAPLNGS